MMVLVAVGGDRWKCPEGHTLIMSSERFLINYRDNDLYFTLVSGVMVRYCSKCKSDYIFDDSGEMVRISKQEAKKRIAEEWPRLM